MKKLTDSQLIILDSLSMSSVKLEWIFFCEEAYIEIFNLPWHGLSPSACYLALADLIEQKLAEVRRDNAPEAVGARVGLTYFGGCTWENIFVNSLNMYISSSASFLEKENEWINEFECVEKDTLERLHSCITSLALPDWIVVGPIIRFSNWEIFDWKIIDGAYKFSIIARRKNWFESPEHGVVFDHFYQIKDKWRKPHINLRHSANPA